MPVMYNNYVTDADNMLLDLSNIKFFLQKLLKIILTYKKSYMHSTSAFYWAFRSIGIIILYHTMI